MAATFYTMKSKIYEITGEINPVWSHLLDDKPQYAVKVEWEGCDTIIITDGTYCYFENNPRKYYKLMGPRNLSKVYWKLIHKEQGTFKLHFPNDN